MAIFKPSQPHHSDEADLARKVLDGIVSLIPGGTAMFDALVGPILERRRTEWKTDVGVDLAGLAEQGRIDLAALADDPAFVDAVLKASAIAMTTSQSRKRAALRAAIMNAAIPGGPDEVQQQYFLALTDRLTEAHLAMLALFNDPVRHSSGASVHTGLQLFEQAVPNARSTRPLYEGAWRDLHNAGLVSTPSIDNGPEGGPEHIRRITELGKQYIRFITHPA